MYRIKQISIGLLDSFLKFPKFVSDSETSKLYWLVRLRWAALLLFFLMSISGYLLGTLSRTNLFIFLGSMSFLLVYNLFTYLFYIQPQRAINSLVICFQLAIDLVVLTLILSLFRDFSNPIVGIFILNVALGGVLIRGKYSFPFILLSHALLALLQIHIIQGDPELVDKKLIIQFSMSHILVFCVWMIMRSLGDYLEKHFEEQAKIKINIEKQDRLRALGSLAAGFSHEFASPLNAAKLLLDRLERGLKEIKIDNVIMKNLSEAQASIQNCQEVIHQMNSSQLDVRSYQMRLVPAKDFIADIVDSWRDEHLLATVTIEVHGVENIKIPPINFAQVILNLLDNAFEASPNTEIKILMSQINNNIVFTTEDQGPGFSDKVIERQGEPFVTTKKNGTGLGLYVSEIFAQSMGGQLVIENKSNHGAKVSISWPFENSSINNKKDLV